MLVKLTSVSNGGNSPVALRCPACRQIGTFEPLQNVTDIHVAPLFLGQRRCPNPQCRTHVFCIYDPNGKVLKSYPPERIDFDPKNIPVPIAKTFTEAVACRAEGLHVAAAIMIRRTLEELCEDEQATGATLKARIAALQGSVVLPQSLLQALDDLRLLGNDAAHIEAKTFDAIGEDELDVAIELTKEILKSVYQLDDLLNRLRALKK
jgi:Domain of unknown function (DUF4145)